GGGEWLFGPEITARYGGALMWLATIAIVLQVFYNLEVGRYALYCGEPVFTGFLRTRPGPRFWIAFFLLLSLGAMVPGLAFHAASVLAALWLGAPPSEVNRSFVVGVAFGCTALAFLPVLFGRKIYDTMQAVMTVKVVGVLSFCAVVSLALVDWQNWINVFMGFWSFGTVPSSDAASGETTVNIAAFWLGHGRLPSIGLGEMAIIGGFIGYAGGGGLGNSLYGNYVRDKGWGNGANVGAIPSAFGGRTVTLSHFGKVFPVTSENLRRWRGWWRVILVDQAAVWAPGCFVGMALPALLSLQFAASSAGVPVNGAAAQAAAAASARAASTGSAAASAASAPSSRNFQWGAAMVTAEGMRRDQRLSPVQGRLLWTMMLIAGLLVLLPSQMSVVDEVCRRWTDVIWSASPRVRAEMHGGEVRRIYYGLAACYLAWCLGTLYLFGAYGTPRLMTLLIGNLGNLALGLTSFHILWINCRWLPPAIRPGVVARCGLSACGTFYLAVAGLVFYQSVLAN
ncbi:MAG: Nramp family divalent metal transporter, partial [Pirellulales bacterium]|nr:Nramp family divalent metal transporter [Pirellulales bacterium]